jgi:hypothetical protein
MGVLPVQSYIIENEIYADEYLTNLLKNPDYRSMDVVHARAAKRCKDERVKNYFINKAKEMLRA